MPKPKTKVKERPLLPKLALATKPAQSIPKIPHYRDGKKVLYFTPKKGEKLDTCATINDKYICCNVKVLKSVSNCPFDCSYCFLQSYLTNSTTTIVDDTDALMAEVTEKLATQPWRFFRIGTWELGDSLALEKESGQASKLIPAFAKLNNVVLELKTKSDCVDTLLDLDHRQKTVISWSLNTHAIVDQEEHKTASLDARLNAMGKAAKAGYLIGAHFDPMILHDDWERGYDTLVQQMFEHVTPEQIAWISIGSLRFNPEQKQLMETHFPGSALTAAEMVTGDDNKVRYIKPKRIEMYQHLLASLKRYGGDDLFVYLCMERWDVWEKIMGYSPKSIGHLDYLFADRFHQKFSHIVPDRPNLDLYETHQRT